jgi:hypothetical protein
MEDRTLLAFWIVPPSKHGPLGFGVTAFDLEDALQIIASFGYVLPDDGSKLRVTQGVKFDDLDKNHVVPNMGPMVVRGLWYPFVRLGL